MYAMEPVTKLAIPADTAAQTLGLLFLLPRDICCNCGAHEGLQVVPMPLPVSGLTGESTVPLLLPRCARCLPTARRLPPRIGRMLRWVPLFFVISVLPVFGVLHLFGLRLQDNSGAVFSALIMLSVFAPLMLMRRRPPEHDSQTSYYQAVRIKPRKTFLGRTVAIEFEFTNAAYARRCREALDTERGAC